MVQADNQRLVARMWLDVQPYTTAATEVLVLMLQQTKETSFDTW